MTILITDNFKNGRFKIPTNTYQETDLSQYIDNVESKYLIEMFGKELYDLFIIDLALPTAGEPTDPRFIKVFEPFTDQTDGCLTISKGIKVMLEGFTYFEYSRDLSPRLTTVGSKKATSENAIDAPVDLVSRYNQSIENYKVIQNYMLNIDPDTYPEFEGVNLDYNHPF